MLSFPDLEPICCSMSGSNCCFLTCIQISQEAGKVVCYSHLLRNFPQLIVIGTVKRFGVVNKAEFKQKNVFQINKQNKTQSELSMCYVYIANLFRVRIVKMIKEIWEQNECTDEKLEGFFNKTIRKYKESQTELKNAIT